MLLVLRSSLTISNVKIFNALSTTYIHRPYRRIICNGNKTSSIRMIRILFETMLSLRTGLGRSSRFGFSGTSSGGCVDNKIHNSNHFRTPKQRTCAHFMEEAPISILLYTATDHCVSKQPLFLSVFLIESTHIH